MYTGEETLPGARVYRLIPVVVVGLMHVGCAFNRSADASPAYIPSFGKRTRISSPVALAVVAQELGCTTQETSAWEDEQLVKARGCRRMVYFEKQSSKSWERIGPVFELTAEDEVVDSDALVTKSKMVSGARWELFQDDLRQLGRTGHREFTARVLCILRIDGTLHHCLVIGSHPTFSDAVGKVLKTYRLEPATLDGRPVPVDFEIVESLKKLSSAP